MKLKNLTELVGKTGYMSKVYRGEGDDNKFYLLKRNTCRPTPEQLEFMYWLMKNRHPSLLTPVEIRGEIGTPLEEIYPYIGPSSMLLDNFLDGIFPYGDHRVMGGWNFRLALKIMNQIAFGLGLINGAGFIKHDLKPKDVFVNAATLDTIVFDYNCVRRKYILNEGIDTWNDVPPEYRRGNTEIDFTFDVYQVGRLCRAMIYGLNTPQEAEPRIEVPDSVLETIAKATSSDKSQRYRDCRELQKAIARLVVR